MNNATQLVSRKKEIEPRYTALNNSAGIQLSMLSNTNYPHCKQMPPRNRTSLSVIAVIQKHPCV